MLQSPNLLHSLLPDYLHSVKISFVPRTQNWWSPVLPVQPYQCWDEGIIIFLSILVSPLQPNIQTGMQLALIIVDSFSIHCPLGTPGPFLQSFFLIWAVPSLYWSMVFDVSDAELWICLCWASWGFCRPICAACQSNSEWHTPICFFSRLQRVRSGSSPWSLMMLLNSIGPLLSLEKLFL